MCLSSDGRVLEDRTCPSLVGAGLCDDEGLNLAAVLQFHLAPDLKQSYCFAAHEKLDLYLFPVACIDVFCFVCVRSEYKEVKAECQFFLSRLPFFAIALLVLTGSSVFH